MSDDIDSIRADLWEKMRAKGKPYRESFVAAHFSSNVAAQIQTLREQREWTQRELANRTGMTQARISILENPSYDKYSFSTLRRIAAAFDVAYVGRFIPFSDLVDWVSDLSPEKLRASEFDKDALKPRDGRRAADRARAELSALPLSEQVKDMIPVLAFGTPEAPTPPEKPSQISQLTILSEPEQDHNALQTNPANPFNSLLATAA